MKKLLATAALAFCLILSGCALSFNLNSSPLEGESLSTESSAPENGTSEAPPSHQHDFKAVKKQALSCTQDEKIDYACACGEKKTEIITAATGHDFKEVSITPATCVEGGNAFLRCSCGEEESEILPALGHTFDGEGFSPSRLYECSRVNCGVVSFPKQMSTVDRTCTYTPKMAEDMEERYFELIALLREVGVYEEGRHDYEEGSSLAQTNTRFKELWSAYSSALTDLGAQYQYGQFAYHQDMGSAEKAAAYAGARQAYAVAVSRYYGLYQAVYDSALRNYYYHGYSQEAIEDLLAQGGSYVNEEVVALENANAELEMDFYALNNPGVGDEILNIYGSLVENNKRIATLSGYDDYMAYAYAEEYGREYEYTFFDSFYGYVKEYLSPLFIQYDVAYRWLNTDSLSAAARAEYNSMTSGSFFTDVYANGTLNDFMRESFTGTLDYGTQMEKLFAHGDYFLGEYQGAYAWKISKENTPIVYFGPNYQEAMTVAHELGHYMNFVFGSSSGSYDLMETHSQGMENLFLFYLKGEMQKTAYDVFKIEAIYGNLATILLSTSVNAFEQAVYTDSYDGRNASTLMADGKITPNEYDLLYRSIQEDLGIYGLIGASYWRYVTTLNPAYYISYALSMSCSMQLYVKAQSEGLDSAVTAYLQTVSLPKESNGDLTYKQVLQGAGLRAYDEEALYSELYERLRLR